MEIWEARLSLLEMLLYSTCHHIHTEKTFSDDSNMALKAFVVITEAIGYQYQNLDPNKRSSCLSSLMASVITKCIAFMPSATHLQLDGEILMLTSQDPTPASPMDLKTPCIWSFYEPSFGSTDLLRSGTPPDAFDEQVQGGYEPSIQEEQCLLPTSQDTNLVSSKTVGLVLLSRNPDRKTG